MTEEKETTVLNTSVGADAGQPNQNLCDNSLADSLEEYNRFFRQLNDPSYLPTVSMRELYETAYESKPPLIDGLLFPGTYLLVGAPKLGKSFLVAQIAYENMNVDLSRTPMNVHYQSCGVTYNAHLDKLVEEGCISLRGLKKDAKVFDEMIFDVNTAYFEERGGYEYACRFYEEAFRFAQKEYGQENIVSAVMHADELNTALTEQLGHPVYHYHMHVVALPVVDKEVLWTKWCKDPALVGTVKEDEQYPGSGYGGDK